MVPLYNKCINYVPQRDHVEDYCELAEKWGGGVEVGLRALENYKLTAIYARELAI